MTIPVRYAGAGRQRVHPLTPPLRAWKTLVVVLVIVVINAGAVLMAALAAVGGAAADAPLLAALMTLLLIVIVGGIIAGIAAWSWHQRFYELDAQEIRTGSGIFFRQRRTARYDRIQSVDIRQPLLPRLFGLGELTVETAGGADSALVIGYLDVPTLERLRAEVLAATGRRRAQSVPEPGVVDPGLVEPGPVEHGAVERRTAAPGLPGRVLAGPIPPPRLVGMVILTFGVGALAALLAVIVVGILGGGAFGAVFAAVGAVALLWVPLDRFWNQQLTLHDDTERLQITAGLASTRRQTVPLRRIHALRLRRPLLWQIPDWAELESSIAGYGDAQEQSGVTRLIAVGQTDDVVGAMNEILWRIGDDERTPLRSRQSPAAAKWVSPIDWQEQGVTISRTGISVTWGRLNRQYAVVPWRHVQGAALSQNPVQRLLGIADVRAAVVAGPAQVIARDLTVADARELLADILTARRTVSG
ncbi:hypothetical protein GOHSU_04_00610 [Gordonia hirsuta DSM 44140 = NBRC 16056]|uniref:YdbS-like PH domain-containing protein n=1 Tax=Gordonia hirsuta DSM 44140 = NBRC 16056 TaxID=1121927 RepID=L7L813_9ACTN|nr:PH domain-containing protein [Gordonia hirsuta]GAC56192.1 hypothetical protein GOHSU_04_00610 [Gordonia hirsuta DSM 44140 = NBRC 16056]